MVVKKEIVYPIFLRCLTAVHPDTPDLDYWKEVFEDLAYNVCPAGTYILKGVFCCSVKNKEFIYNFLDPVRSDLKIYEDITRFLREKLHLVGKAERKQAIQQFEHDGLLRDDLNWVNIRKKSYKNILFQNFLINAKHQYHLRDRDIKKIYNFINLGLMLKAIKSSDIEYHNGDILDIKCVRFSEGHYKFDLDIYESIDDVVSLSNILSWNPISIDSNNLMACVYIRPDLQILRLFQNALLNNILVKITDTTSVYDGLIVFGTIDKSGDCVTTNQKFFNGDQVYAITLDYPWHGYPVVNGRLTLNPPDVQVNPLNYELQVPAAPTDSLAAAGRPNPLVPTHSGPKPNLSLYFYVIVLIIVLLLLLLMHG